MSPNLSLGVCFSRARIDRFAFCGRIIDLSPFTFQRCARPTTANETFRKVSLVRRRRRERDGGARDKICTELLINAFEFCSGFSVAAFVELPKQHAKMPCQPAGTEREPVSKCAREIRDRNVQRWNELPVLSVFPLRVSVPALARSVCGDSSQSVSGGASEDLNGGPFGAMSRAPHPVCVRKLKPASHSLSHLFLCARRGGGKGQNEIIKMTFDSLIALEVYV